MSEHPMQAVSCVVCVCVGGGGGGGGGGEAPLAPPLDPPLGVVITVISMCMHA